MNLLERLKSIARPAGGGNPLVAAPPMPPPPPPPVARPPNAPLSDDDAAPHDPAPEDVGLRDSVASGHYNNATGELYPGFAIRADDVVLDVGCGDGDKAHFCAQSGAAIIYVDSDPAQVALAGQRLAGSRARSLTPIVSGAYPLPLEDATATRVIASELIAQVDDPVALLKELVRVGRPGALYLLSVSDPVCEGLQQKLAPAAHFQNLKFVRVVGREAFFRMVTDAGLEVVTQGSHGFYWAMWLSLFWTCKVDLSVANQHPVMRNWSATWSALLDTEDGPRIKRALDNLMPISQYIVARKSQDAGI